jgi:hypothetical protein
MKSYSLTSELPSMASMGLKVKLEKSYPFHPMVDMYERHLEILFLDYKLFHLDKRVPNYEEIVKKWWHKRFLLFIRKEFNLDHRPVPQPIFSEDEFFERYPDMRQKWDIQKARHILLESKRDRFGKIKNDFEHHLQYQWIKDKKYEYMMRKIGLREEPYWRRRTRRKCTDKYANAILWCWHWKCWTIRIKYLPLIPYYWVRFKLYDKLHPELMDIH